jgi:hypothetical protein
MPFFVTLASPSVSLVLLPQATVSVSECFGGKEVRIAFGCCVSISRFFSGQSGKLHSLHVNSGFSFTSSFLSSSFGLISTRQSLPLQIGSKVGLPPPFGIVSMPDSVLDPRRAPSSLMDGSGHRSIV